MGWLRKAQSIPAFPDSAVRAGSGPVQGNAFLEWIGGGPNNPLYPDPNFANNADYGFDKNELVYACIMEKATSLPDAPFRVFGPDGLGEPRENHPLRQLIANPNPATTEFELMELTSIFMDLAGIAFWEIVEDRAGRPVELWPLRPDLVRIFPMQNGHHEYGYAIGDGRIYPLGTNVLAFKYPNPMNPTLGQAPMRPANRAVALDNEATDFVKALLQNRAVPGTVIETEQKIDDLIVERLSTKWRERFGGNNRGLPAFLQKGMKVHTLGLDLGQLEFPDLRTISESRICMSFGVPPILVGAKVGLDRSTFANYQEARRSLWEETLMPLQKRMQQVIVTKLLPRVEGPRPRKTVCRFDNSEVLALREAEGKRWELATQALRAGAITVNQFARYVGLPTVAEGDVYLRQAGVIPTDVLGNMLATNPAINITRTEEPADDEADSDEEATEEEVDDEADSATAASSGKSYKAADEDRDEFTEAIADVVRAQRDEVLSLVKSSEALLALAPQRYKADDLWDRGKWNRRLTEAMEPHMLSTAHRAGRKVDANEDPTIMDGYVHVTAERTARDWNEETESAVAAAVAVGGKEVVDAVAGIFALAAGVRAATLATTVRTEVNGFAKVDTAKRVGLATKTWVVRSTNPRKEHLAVNGETVPVEAPFSNGRMWPGGPNCQCDVTFGKET